MTFAVLLFAKLAVIVPPILIAVESLLYHIETVAPPLFAPFELQYSSAFTQVFPPAESVMEETSDVFPSVVEVLSMATRTTTTPPIGQFWPDVVRATVVAAVLFAVAPKPPTFAQAI
jgi:hypothetical protein